MPARIGHPPVLRQLYRHFSLHLARADQQIEQLSSGQRVNRSSDDPASVALADGLRSEIRTLVEGERNLQQGIQMLQVAEGSLAEITNMMRRLEELAVQAASSTYSDEDRRGINREFQVLKEEIERIACATRYNDIPLLDAEGEFPIQAGPSETSNDVSWIQIGDMRASGTALNLESLTIDTRLSAQNAIDVLKIAQEKVLDERHRLAAFQNRLQLSATTTASAIEKMSGSEGAIRDADVARSVAELTHSQILAQAAASLAQEEDVDVRQILSLLQ